MALASKDIFIGSGDLYVVPFTGTIPTDATVEVEANRLGHIKDGATITYNPTFYEAKDDLGKVSKIALVEEEVIFKSGIITWNLDTLAKLTTTADIEEGSSTVGSEAPDKIYIGGMENYTPAQYFLRFVHVDGKHRVSMVCSVNGGFEIGFKKDAETSIDAEFKAQPFDDDDQKSRLLIMTQPHA